MSSRSCSAGSDNAGGAGGSGGRAPGQVLTCCGGVAALPGIEHLDVVRRTPVRRHTHRAGGAEWLLLEQANDEGGEGDTMVVERERDLTLSASARHIVEQIDLSLESIKVGEYGYSEHSGKPIPRERLKAIPWTTELVEERVGTFGRR